MTDVLSAFIPIWLLTVLGYLIARFALVGAESVDVEGVLGRFVFRIAMPAALFGMLARSDLHVLANMSIVAFGVSSLVVCAIGLGVSTRVFGRGIGDGALAGMASGYVNSANLGIPVALQVVGNAGLLSTVILFNQMLVTPTILVLMDLGRDEGVGWRRRVRGVVTMPARNPILIASALGALFAATHWHVPGDLSRALSMLGGAAVPIALVTLGMSLHVGPKPASDASTVSSAATSTENAQRKRQATLEAAIAIALKLALQPVLAYLLARYALHLHPRDVLAVTLCAALPTAQNVYIYAREYALDTAFARNTIVVSTLLSMAGLWTVVALLK